MEKSVSTMARFPISRGERGVNKVIQSRSRAALDFLWRHVFGGFEMIRGCDAMGRGGERLRPMWIVERDAYSILQGAQSFSLTSHLLRRPYHVATC